MPSPNPNEPPRSMSRLRLRPLVVTLLAATAVACAAAAKREARTPFQQVGQAEHSWIRECSGVAASRRHPGVFWVHNDSGNEPCLFALTADGKTRGVFRVSAENKDWEDLAIDAVGRLYIADTGNNEEERSQIQVYRVAEPDLPADAAPNQKPAPLRLRPEKTWRLKYPSDPFDCEALFVTATHGYLISKESKKHSAKLYRFALGEGAQPGDVKGQLESVADLPIRDPVTAADLSPDGKRLAVLSDGGLFVFSVANGDILTAVKTEPVFFKIPDDNCEGVCFTPDGIVITSEKGRVYRMAEGKAEDRG
jgi:hypothetical protein